MTTEVALLHKQLEVLRNTAATVLNLILWAWEKMPAQPGPLLWSWDCCADGGKWLLVETWHSKVTVAPSTDEKRLFQLPWHQKTCLVVMSD